jgi:hypothetical protein
MAIVRSMFTFRRKPRDGNGDALMYWHKTRRYGSVTASLLANRVAE